jgi:hypothetical protein
MTRYADPERCPDCRGPMPYASTRCPSCGIDLDGPLAARLFSTLSTADDLLAQLRQRSLVGAVAAPSGGASPPSAPLRFPDGPAAGPAAPGRVSSALSTASVPKILLALGAVCLLVAALVFLAVAWSAMGVAGRTATLVAVTFVAGTVTAGTARRDLRAAAESLAVVTLGLLAFDLVGARDSGWLGDLGTPAFSVLLGITVAAAGTLAALLVRRTPAGALTGAEAVAVLGVATAATGLTQTSWLPWSAALVLGVVAAGVTAAATYHLRLRVLTHGCAVVCGVTWAVLTASSVARALDHPSVRDLWLGLEAWPLVTATVLVVTLALLRPLPGVTRRTALALGEVLVASVVLAPVTDETPTALTVTGAALVVVVAAVTWLAPAAWRQAGALALALGGVWMASVAAALTAESFDRVLAAGAALWQGTAAGGFGVRPESAGSVAAWLLPVTALVTAMALLTLARGLSWVDRAVGPVADLDVVAAAAVVTVALSLALHAVPVWSVVAVLLLGGAGSAVRGLRRGRLLPLALSAGLSAVAVGVSLHAEWLTLAALAVVTGVTLLVHLRWPTVETSAVAGAVAATAVTGLVWTSGALADASGEWVAAAGLASLAAWVLGLAPAARRLMAAPVSAALAGTEVGALLSATIVSLAGVTAAPSGHQATWLAVYLTTVGGTASAVALLRPHRRPVGWLGGLLLAAASWVRLDAVGVETPEAYTLPSAAALLLVGFLHLRRHPTAGTATALSAGLGLALLPSLLWTLWEPVSLRALLLGAACLLLVLAGARLRWSAPLVAGATVGALLVLREAAPVADAVPRWALIGAAGAVLLTAGITWERRARDARRMAGYVRTLR